MFRRTSPYTYSSRSYEDSLQSSAYSLDETSSQGSDLCRPSAKSIYMRRKEYAESMNKQLFKFQYRVEHLFTCELDEVEVRGVEESVERLKLLEVMGHVWGQDMLLEVHDGSLLLSDIETKEELERLALSSVLEVRAMLDACVYDSLLTVSLQESHGVTRVFMFQCDSVRADYIKQGLERALQNRASEAQHGSPSLSPPITSREPAYQRTENTPTCATQHPPPYTEHDRNVDILNHLINDIEEFVDTVVTVVPKVSKKKKKKKQKKKQKAVKGLPSKEEFTVCLQKIKMAFNLLGHLNGHINNPSAADLAHGLFSMLDVVVGRCSDDLPPSVVAPLLEPECVRFLGEEASPEEDQLWQTLGDAWNIPSTKWPEDDDDIPTFTPVFNDGWEPPQVTHPNRNQITHTNRESESHQEIQSATQDTKSSPQKSSEESLPSYMIVSHDFRGRNDRELSVMKGEEVELLDMSKRWWKVRNGHGEEGFVPNNVLKSRDSDETQEVESNPTLNRKSRPDEVKDWLEHKGFTKITVRCLGGLSGAMLLGMTREELKIVCPEEGGRVYYQLQNVKSALALAREVRPLV
ncbi:epidermal growth factor receptor kinase substrate 8-like protein 3 [Brachyhypopomus gauderio]|uniref:epidermal growth factor receptor kinase substrate 8-like protein 3 n=1 Tax=Brachyhypopomus gauderio TaxID=698409 RepID=UPI004042CDB1